jgi:uncharacterized protein
MGDSQSESGNGDRRHFMHMGLAAAGLGLAGANVAAQTPAPAQSAAPSASAAKLPMYLVVYRPGPAWLQGKPLAEQPAIRDHGKYMLELYRRGVLKFAGGFGDGSGGALAFEAENDASAQAVVAADPAVTSQMFSFELRHWRLVDWPERSRRSP